MIPKPELAQAAARELHWIAPTSFEDAPVQFDQNQPGRPRNSVPVKVQGPVMRDTGKGLRQPFPPLGPLLLLPELI
jgi:hypothetical protein